MLKKDGEENKGELFLTLNEITGIFCLMPPIWKGLKSIADALNQHYIKKGDVLKAPAFKYI